MNATTWAAWVGAVGTATNAAALIVVERRKAKPDLVLSPRYFPPHKDVRHGGPSDVVEVRVAGALGVAIFAAGLAPARRLWRWRRVRLPSHLRDGGRLPVAVPAGGHIDINMSVDKVADRIRRTKSYVAWIETSGGRRIYSPESVQPHGREWDPDSG